MKKIILTPFLLFLFLTSFVFANTVSLSEQIIHYWKLDEVISPYIDTYGSVNGLCSIDCPTSGEGQVNNAQIFDGTNDEINIIDDGTFDWATVDSFTVEFWMKPDSTTTDLQVVVGRHKGSTGTVSWWVGRENNKIKFQLDSSAIASDKDIPLDQWTHVVIIRDATNNETRLYINGEKDNSSITGTTPNSFAGEKPFNIGFFYDGYHFDGTLDEIAIFNKVLSLTVINQHYQNGLAGKDFTGTKSGKILRITPQTNHIQTNRDLITNALTVHLEVGLGVMFALDEGSVSQQIIVDTTQPYEVTFYDVELGEHRIDYYIVDELQKKQSGDENYESVENIGIGDISIAVGDSITFGQGDDLVSDNISADGRNTGGGFEPILNDHLSGIYGYPYSVINEGIAGETTQEGLARLPSALTKYTEASRVLLLYGTNDTHIWSKLESGKGLSIGDTGYADTYKDYIKQMIDLVNDAGKKITIAKVPFALGESSTLGDYSDSIEDGHRNVQAREFNEVIDELVEDPSNNMIVAGPDFYFYFKENYANEYSDNLHPNGLGYKSMAELWQDVLLEYKLF